LEPASLLVEGAPATLWLSGFRRHMLDSIAREGRVLNAA
jgi:hypothetical protein